RDAKLQNITISVIKSSKQYIVQNIIAISPNICLETSLLALCTPKRENPQNKHWKKLFITAC
ncbi:MAG: hypothetical protein QGG88_05775, partial [Gammaproteobacteria bacterium]|nr:hypothetical protein [Gammaproteobacteria bacterium]